MTETDMRMTLLVSDSGASLRIEDALSGTCLVDAEIPADAFCAMLGRLPRVHIKANHGPLDRVGKRMENKKFSFEIPDKWVFRPHDKNEELAALADAACPEGWESDNYFNSRDTFFEKDGKRYAQTTCRRWVDVETEQTANAE